MTRPIRVEINFSAIRHNYLISKQNAPQAKAFAVIKANAYGHGDLAVAKALADIADGFALLNLSDAIELRKAGIQQPIVLLEGPFDEDELALMAQHQVAGAIHSFHQIEWLKNQTFAKPFEAWLKINSGMNRLGFRPEEAAQALAELKTLPQVKVSTVMTHFATADDEHGIDFQWQNFQPLTEWEELDICTSNSAATFRYPSTHFNKIRPGITLYGCTPFEDQTAEALNLQPAMTLSADIIGIQHLNTGDAVGYGATFIADKAMRIGVVACGYADGYPRCLGTGTPVLIDGQPSRTIGRVSMDMLVVDLTDLPNAKLGSKVTLWGEGLPLETIAKASNTLAYELMCGIALRVPRVHRY